jgi:branched-chain amino acid transport system ATP-binding protein
MNAVPSKDSILTVEDLTKDFGKFRAVDGVGFTVLRSDVMAMIGPNGAGKSTCFDLITGQLRPSAGRVVLRDRNITGRPPHQICHLGIGRTFQTPALFGSMTVAENVQMAMISAEGRLKALSPRATRLYRDDALALLDEVRMADKADLPCGHLAYGDLRRAELAVALAHGPKLLLMDEPAAGIPAPGRARFMETCVELALRGGAAVLFSERDLDMVFHFAGRVVVLDHGQVIAEGSPLEVRDDERVREAYLGADFSHLKVNEHATSI